MLTPGQFSLKTIKLLLAKKLGQIAYFTKPKGTTKGLLMKRYCPVTSKPFITWRL